MQFGRIPLQRRELNANNIAGCHSSEGLCQNPAWVPAGACPRAGQRPDPGAGTTRIRKPLMAPQFGYLLPTRERVMEGRPETGSLLDLAARAESLGFDSVWVGDSLLARPRHDPLTLLAAVAARTRKAMLGTAVFLPALRNPVVLAHQLATLDQISEGRLILGVGIASDLPNIRAEFAAAGVPFEKRVGRMLEGLRLMRALWSGKPVDWDGRWPVQRGELGVIPHRPGGPPIWIGGLAPAAIERAGRHF